jgi:hypothetical protein
LSSKSVHFGDDVGLVLLGQFLVADPSTSLDDPLDSSLEETDDMRVRSILRLLIRVIGETNCHSLDRRVERVFDELLVMASQANNRWSRVSRSMGCDSSEIVVALMREERLASAELVGGNLQSNLCRISISIPAALTIGRLAERGLVAESGAERHFGQAPLERLVVYDPFLIIQ